MITKIFKLAKLESEWLKYYGHISSREEETFDDELFYNRMKSIGYAKVNSPLYERCPMGYVSSLNPENVTILGSGPRNHSKSVYTPLEFVIYNKIEGYQDLISIIKK